MNRRPVTTIAAAALGVLLIAACGGSTTKRPSTHTTTQTTVTTTVKPSGAKVLTSAVVAAVEADHKTSVSALWRNAVPAKPVATAGPALTNLRRAVAGRRKQGVRIRMLEDHLRVISTTLDPSYATASAVIVDVERVQPSHANGKPLGKSVRQTERVKLELHRVGDSDRFVVWKVEYLK